MMETRYNLRSARREDHAIPVQLQLQSDEDFFNQTLGASHPSPGQVSFSQSNGTSESDLDMSGLLNISNQICSSPDFGSNKCARSAGHTHDSI